MNMKIVFTHRGDFEAVRAAEAWCSERGISVGAMQGPAPRGLRYGDYNIHKWRNLRKREIAALDGMMTGDMRNGPVYVDVRDLPPNDEAKRPSDSEVALERLVGRRRLSMEQLPMITNRQSWCCENGCGECRPVQIDFEHSRTEDMDSNLIESKTEKVWASHCCKAGLMLWDEDKQDFIEWAPND